ncbi:MAG: N-formylglutamate amidohydrolase [Kiritimatiellae bacterium]|nr:N-formylglutamate amidohydrolase [Kiritimatiellia bacterium]
MTDRIWKTEPGDGPLVATAIHDGTNVRDEVREHMVLGAGVRRREEDPFTAEWTHMAPTRIVGTRSRFEVDLNRPREKAVYYTPDDCWDLRVWRDGIPDDVAARSLRNYDAFYAMLGKIYAGLADEYGRFVVFDLHSYNHRRGGPDVPPADQTMNPDVNVGTGTMQQRATWAPVIDRFIQDLGNYDFPGGRLDVRENVRFRGGQHARWAHETFDGAVCVLSIEVKKFFMNEWSGMANPELVDEVGKALASTVPGVLAELGRL